MRVCAKWNFNPAFWNDFQVLPIIDFSFHIVFYLSIARCIWEVLDAFKSGAIFHDKLHSRALFIWELSYCRVILATDFVTESLSSIPTASGWPPSKKDSGPLSSGAKSIDLLLFCFLSPWLSLWVALSQFSLSFLILAGVCLISFLELLFPVLYRVLIRVWLGGPACLFLLLLARKAFRNGLCLGNPKFWSPSSPTL